MILLTIKDVFGRRLIQQYFKDRIHQGYIRYDGPGRIDGKKKYYAYSYEPIQFFEYKSRQRHYAKYVGDLI